MKGERLLPADRDSAWRLLNDPETLKQCVPGCESMTAAADGSYDVAMTAAVGPVKARFKGRMSLADVEPPSRYRLVFEGQSAQAGFARGQARVELEALSAHETRLHYTATAQIGGKLAQIGSRLIDAAAAATADRFFEAFAAQLAATTQEPGAAAPGAAAPAPPVRFGFWRWLSALLRHLFARPAR
ncbi:MAG TPA: carbon monoxide dehydrogenase subunit G [Steroidobacteraceae bacterium]|nr:carbon monoxide dehydrogenase subunit G [Steroidobacteraceae bacterium]